MCPVCLTSAMLIAGSVLSAGGITAIVVRKLGGRSAGEFHPIPTPATEEHHG
ncbi:hypothetical protein HDF16_001724 [Granulicella aggregans]|uniref:Uncharacterized protein n=1 Tax=Granulicella aggregans TaxID=474949 RepID=A0A7W7ZBV1_9BACT|nr:hypothetical protein [Granulicella aggregans]